MNFQATLNLNDLNPGKLVVNSSLFAFVTLFALKLDKSINCDWFIVFLPIWIWKFIAILGGIVGIVVFCRFPRTERADPDSYVHFKAMLISLSLHMLLLMFEILACDNLTSGRHLWIIVFIPLIFASIVSIRACVWSVKHDRCFELELFLAVNTLQFVALPLKLDNFVNWNWEVVFVPLWIVVCLCLVSCIYNIIFCGIIMRTPEISLQQKRSALHNAIGNTMTVVPLLCFQVVIADKLDQTIKISYIFAFSPLLLAILSLLVLSFCAKGGNKWWFGIRKNFYQFILSFLPFLQEYGNISYRPEQSQSNNFNVESGQTVPLDYDEDPVERRGHKKFNDNHKPVAAISSIYSPD